jgi:hypothetical protein
LGGGFGFGGHGNGKLKIINGRPDDNSPKREG